MPLLLECSFALSCASLYFLTLSPIKAWCSLRRLNTCLFRGLRIRSESDDHPRRLPLVVRQSCCSSDDESHFGRLPFDVQPDSCLISLLNMPLDKVRFYRWI